MKDWTTKTIGEVCQFSNGLWKGEKPPFVNVGVIRNTNFKKDGTLDDSDIAYLDVEAKKLEKRRLQFGDIILEKSGGGPKQPVGRVVLFDKTKGDFSFSNFTAALRVINSRELNFRFVHKFLHWAYLSGVTERMQTNSTGIRNLDADAYKSIEISFPTLAEQERIVKLLDEADELRKLRKRADNRTANLIPGLFNEMFGDPARNQKGWPIKPFGELVANQDGRRKPVKASDRAQRQGVYPYYGASGIIDYVEKYLFDETALLIGEDGANLVARSTPIAFLAHGKYWVNNHAHVLTDNGNADLIYLCEALNLRDLTDYVTGSAQPKLNQANMNRMPFPVPPLSLQKEFAKRVTEIRKLEAAQATSRHRLEDLFQSMLHKAFNGEL